MAQFPIRVDISTMLDATQQLIDESVLPRLSQAVKMVAQQTHFNWIEAIQRAKLWQGEKDAYAETIDMQMTGPFSAEVWSTYRHAEEIETGRPARDLKVMLNTSPKVRTSRNGTRYLIIPFRHNTPGNDAHAPAMPEHIFHQARDLEASKIIGMGTRKSGLNASDPKTRTHLTVPQARYQWGGRLRVTEKADKRFDSMYRFENKTPGGARYSSYLTFRVMSEKSSGWIVPPVPGQNIAKGVADRMRDVAESAFTEAVKRDTGTF